jgi:cardiolipin synthase
MSISKENNQLKIVKSGFPFFHTITNLIDQAKEIIHLAFYIVEDDETGQEILRKLKLAALRGVKVFLLVDGYASAHLNEEDFKVNNFYFKKFNPINIFNINRLARRLHIKLLVIDCKEALVGGINIGNRYRGSQEEVAWLDFAVQVTGETAIKLHRLAETLWERKFRFARKNRRIVLNDSNRKRSEVKVGYLINDWLRGFNQINKRYLYQIRNSQKEIWIMNSYFWPGNQLLKAIRNAAKRGVSIHFVLPHISDNMFFSASIRYFYKVLLQYPTIKIYEWPYSVLHAKMAFVDRSWVTIGSYNLNILSQFRSIELNIETNDKHFLEEVKFEFEKVISTCIAVQKADYLNSNSIIKHIYHQFSYYLIHIALISLLFFSKKD